MLKRPVRPVGPVGPVVSMGLVFNAIGLQRTAVCCVGSVGCGVCGVMLD